VHVSLDDGPLEGDAELDGTAKEVPEAEARVVARRQQPPPVPRPTAPPASAHPTTHRTAAIK
jgi:hypothetical protein